MTEPPAAAGHHSTCAMQGYQTLRFLPRRDGETPTMPRNDAHCSAGSTALALPFPAELRMPPCGAGTGHPRLADSVHRLGQGTETLECHCPTASAVWEAVPGAPMGTGTPRCPCLLG